MSMLRWKKLSMMAVALPFLLLTACGGRGGHDAAEPAPPPTEPAVAPEHDGAPEMVGHAVATLHGAEGSAIHGEVTFSPAPAGGVEISATISGLDAAGDHGLHIHETGDCSAADFKSAGGHFNPTGVVHGGPNDAEHHAGDLGNITIGEDGSGELHFVSSMLSLDPSSPNAVYARGVILHAKSDDLTSQPTGAAGARLACGVIEPAGG